MCFENLLLGKNNELKNRYMRVDFQNDNSSNQNVTLDELALLKLIAKDPSITQVQLAEKMGVTDRTIKQKNEIIAGKRFYSKSKCQTQWSLGNID